MVSFINVINSFKSQSQFRQIPKHMYLDDTTRKFGMEQIRLQEYWNFKYLMVVFNISIRGIM